MSLCIFFFQAEDGIRDLTVTGVQTCALPITLADAVQSDRAVYAVARELLARLRAARRVPARLLGVAPSQPVRQGGGGQLSLLETPGPTPETNRDAVISRVIDQGRRQFGPAA